MRLHGTEDNMVATWLLWFRKEAIAKHGNNKSHHKQKGVYKEE